MHAIFLLYGKKEEVDLMLRDMTAHKIKLPMHKGKEKKTMVIEAQVRILPFGVYEFVFNREDRDVILTSLKFDRFEASQYNLKSFKMKILMSFLRKFLKCDKIPEFDTKIKYPWITENVMVIPLGIREDADVIDDEKGQFPGWTHEAI